MSKSERKLRNRKVKCYIKIKGKRYSKVVWKKFRDNLSKYWDNKKEYEEGRDKKWRNKVMGSSIQSTKKKINISCS